MEKTVRATLLAYVLPSCFSQLDIMNVIYVKEVDRYPDSEKCPWCSVIVPARNEEKNIRTCVDSIPGQDYPLYEIIVVNDLSDNNTAIVLSDLQEKHP
jgi:chlorobactene glucosyltransferase